MNRLLSICLLLLFLAPSGEGNAQVHSKARVLTTENGLSDNSINCIYKDRKGYVWIGTRYGLNQYDGYAFRVFQPGAGNSISNEVINSIAEDAAGNIWVATMNGLNYYNPTRNVWHNIPSRSTRNEQGLPNSLVWDIHPSRTGKLWIASDVFEFSSYDTRTGKFSYYDWPAFAKTLATQSGSLYASIQKFAVKSETQFWLGTTKGLVHLDTETKQFKWIGGGFNGNVLEVYYDSVTARVYLSTDNGQVFRYDEKDNSYAAVLASLEPYPSTLFNPSFGKNERWLPAGVGLLKISSDINDNRLATHHAALSESLLPGGVRTVYQDDTGIRWIGTSNGIALYDSRPSASFLPLLPISDKASINKMGGALYDSITGNYFICSLDPAAVFIIPAHGGTVRKIVADADGRPFSSCNAIRHDNENNTWLMTDRNVYRYDRLKQEFILFPMPNHGEDVGFRAFIQDGKGDYWFGTTLQGIYHYRLHDKRFDSIPSPFLPWTRKIGSLHWDARHQCVWISAYGSDVLRYDLKTARMEGFEDRPGLSELNMTNEIITDRRGNTWMATSGGGVFRFDADANTFQQFNMRSGLPGNTYISICEDANSNIWLLSERGIDVIDSSGRAQSYHGFKFSTYVSDTRSPHSLHYDKANKELMMAVGGGLYLMPTTHGGPSHRFPVVITGMRIGSNDSNEVRDPWESLEKLPFRHNKIQFHFAGLYYGPQTDVFHEHKLSGYDRFWVRSDDHTASYQNLPAGTYHLEVRARYRNGREAGHVSGTSFRIIPPFWATTWFIVLMIFLAIAIIAWFMYSLIKKLEAEKVLHSFATSLYGQSSMEDICWSITKNCVLKLGFTDCVIYWYEEERKLLVQKAAYGPKNPWRREIYNSMAIPLGKGIVGTVALTGKMEVIKDTSKDPRYIVDDERRLSEISVPIFVDGKLFGVIDSENPRRNFYTRYHGRILKKVASTCAERISRYQAEERLRGKIARDLHDEMGSTLTSINIMSKVALGIAKDQPLHGYLQKIKDNSRRILESIGDMVWVINPANDNFERLMFRMKEFTAEVLDPLKKNYHFEEVGILHSIQLNVEQRKDIYMIFKEAVTNAVKYSEAQELFIRLSEDYGVLTVEIQDNGIGFDQEFVKKGNGLRNMRVRAAQIGADLHIESETGKGSRVVIRLALP